ncbi:MAG: fibronectin type III domain-containing protein, partial [Armatimonadetes bacterium]|nr:fibronectin type III domain-containing protein [Armatimonadota bacterium]
MSYHDLRVARITTIFSALVLLSLGLVFLSAASPASAQSLTLSVTEVTDTTVSLSWVLTIPRGTLSYYELIYDGNIVNVGTVTSYKVTGLQPSTFYSFRLRATTTSGVCPIQPTVQVATKLNAPTNLVGTAVSTSQINLSWADNSTKETGFKVSRGTSASGPWTTVTVGANVTSYSNTGLTAGTTYYYQVCATNSTGDSSYAATSATTQSAVTKPNAPTNLVGTAVSTSQINLSWADNSTNETGFKLNWGTSASGPWTAVNLGANATSYSHTGLSASTTYYYQVCATNSAGDSSYAATSATTQSAVTKPNAPTNLVGTAVSTSQINLSWADNSTNETGFKLNWGTSASGPWTAVN